MMFFMLFMLIVWPFTDAARDGSSAEKAPEDFIIAFKLAMSAARDEVEDKRYSENGTDIVIKSWGDYNKALKAARDSVIPETYGEQLIDNVFADKIRKKFYDTTTKGTSRSGSKIIVSAYDSVTRSSYLLKSESRDDVKAGVWPILEKYGNRIVPNEDSCQETTLMKVLLIFEPLGIDPIVNNKVWMLIQSINPIPHREGNDVLEYDLKHSREVDRCKSSDEGEGVLGDFMRDFGMPLRNAIKERHAADQGARSDSKEACLLSSVSKDLAVLDSAYPKTKLVDQSVLVFAIRPKDDTPNQEEVEIANTRNNVFKVTKNGQTWFLVYGLIDLFAHKGTGKWIQSHKLTGGQYVFGNKKKFSLYPIYSFCMSQYFFYYTDFTNHLSWDPVIGQSWNGTSMQCFKKGGVFEARIEPGSLRSYTTTLHEMIRHDNRMCSLIQTCDAILHDKAPIQNLEQCCRIANDGQDCQL